MFPLQQYLCPLINPCSEVFIYIRCKELGWQGRLTDTFHTSGRGALHRLSSSGGTSCQRHMVVSYYYFYYILMLMIFMFLVVIFKGFEFWHFVAHLLPLSPPR